MNEFLSTSELKDAEAVILKHVQANAFAKEIDCILKNKRIPRRSSILSLDPIMQDGIVVVGGRLDYSNLRLFQHPVILPKDHRVSKLIV